MCSESANKRITRREEHYSLNCTFQNTNKRIDKMKRNKKEKNNIFRNILFEYTKYNIKDLYNKYILKNPHWEHNYNIIKTAYQYRQTHRRFPTHAEQRVIEFLKKHNERFEQQKVIFISNKENKIERFFIADLVIMDTIYEIDGLYHKTKQQKEYDKERTTLLNKVGYKVKRINNGLTKYEPVLNDFFFGYQKYAS